MNLFTTVNAAVAVPQAAAFTGLKIERGSMCRCLFHADNTPSMKLNETYYYCFGCQAHGDAVDLAAKALNLQPKEAAIRLAEAFHVDISGCVRKKEKTWHPFVPHKPDLSALAERLAAIQKQSEDQSREQWLNDAQDTLLRYAGLLKEWKEKHAPASQTEEWHPLFIEACQKESWVEYLLDLTYDPLERENLYDCYQEEIKHIHERIEQYQLEAADERGAA